MIAGPRSLAGVKHVLDTITSTSSTNDKLSVIRISRDVPGFSAVVHMALDPFMMFKIREIPFVPDAEASLPHALLFMKQMAGRKGATNVDRLTLAQLASVDHETVHVINLMLKKDLRCGASVRTFKKIFPDLFEYSPMLCDKDLEAFEKAIDRDWSNVYLEDKFDGVRCTAHMTTQGDVVYLSRNALPFANFGVFDVEIQHASAALRRMNVPDAAVWHIDGEVISVDRDFNKHMSNLRKLNGADPSQFRFSVFDVVPKLADGTTCPFSLADRKRMLAEALEGCQLISPVEYRQDAVRSIQDALFESDLAVARGEEGVVLKYAPSAYVWDRSPLWCKVKPFDEVDLPVIGWEYGTGKNADKMGKLVCLYNGVEVRVGSGYTDEERVEFMTDCPRTIQVKYQEVTKDGSLRFPIFDRRRDDK